MSESHWDGKVLLWDSNDRPVPMHVFKDAYAEPLYPAIQAAAEAKSLDEFLTLWRSTQDTAEDQAEREFELRAAFGPGQVIINVITGRKTRT
jgi:hypothetical protein